MPCVLTDSVSGLSLTFFFALSVGLAVRSSGFRV